MGGPGVAATVPRRTIYTKVMRNSREPLSTPSTPPTARHHPDAERHDTRPSRSAPDQRPLDARPRRRSPAGSGAPAGSDAAGRITLAYRLVFGRPPPIERSRSSGRSRLAGLPRAAAADADRCRGQSGRVKPEPRSATQAAWTDFCHALLNANEFLYVD